MLSLSIRQEGPVSESCAQPNRNIVRAAFFRSAIVARRQRRELLVPLDNAAFSKPLPFIRAAKGECFSAGKAVADIALIQRTRLTFERCDGISSDLPAAEIASEYRSFRFNSEGNEYDGWRQSLSNLRECRWQ